MRCSKIVNFFLILTLITTCTGCAVVAVADAAVTVVATGVKVVAKTVETAVDVVTPSRKKEK
jgi:P pilus assembly chaperone PapD